MLAHVAGIPFEEALLAAPGLVAGATMVAGCRVRCSSMSGHASPEQAATADDAIPAQYVRVVAVDHSPRGDITAGRG